MAKIWQVGGVTLLTVFGLAGCSDSLGDRYVGFAQCLTNAGVKMYGAYWCPHCAKQKQLFGKEGFAKVNYIECDPRGANAQPELCAQNKVELYPTWILADGTSWSGETPLEDLAEKTQCRLPATPA